VKIAANETERKRQECSEPCNFASGPLRIGAGLPGSKRLYRGIVSVGDAADGLIAGVAVAVFRTGRRHCLASQAW